MNRRARRTAVVAIATALISSGGLAQSQATSQAASDVARQADERRSECVRQKQIEGLPVRSLLCLKVIWDESTGTTTLITRLKVTNGTASNRSMLIRMSSRPGKFRDHDVDDYTLAPGSAATFTKQRTVGRYLDHPVAKSRVVLYSGETDDYTVAGETIRATP